MDTEVIEILYIIKGVKGWLRQHPEQVIAWENRMTEDTFDPENVSFKILIQVAQEVWTAMDGENWLRGGYNPLSRQWCEISTAAVTTIFEELRA